MFMEKYIAEGETTPRDRYQTIAKTVGDIATELYGEKDWENRFFQAIWKGWLSPSTPALSNLGTTRGCPVSCSGGHVDDSIHGFYSSRFEAAILTKAGFGTSSNLNEIRPRGSVISSGGTAAGILPVLKGFVQDMREVSQGGVRRGSWAGYLEIEHGDFWEVADYAYNNPDDLNIGWIVTQNFIDGLEAGNEEYILRYQKVMKIRAVLGKGYLLMIDKVNAQNPEMYEPNGLSVKASNLCVAPETMILTPEGCRRIDECVDTYVEVWNGVQWSKVMPVKTGQNQKLIKITTEGGRELECTPYHKFHTVSHRGEVVETRACDLRVGQRLAQYDTFEIKGICDTISSIQDEGRISDTYCFNEPLEHKGVFNGILTGNCSEIMLHSDADHTFTCVLSSANLAFYDDWKDSDLIFLSTVFLDCVAEIFIRQAEEIPGLEKAVAFTRKSRALGLGVLGFHTHLQKNNIPFESFEAHNINNLIFKQIDDQSFEASQWMASVAGEPEWCEGYGVRGTHRLAVAPTMSTALICGGVSQGIEPIVANVYNQASSAGEIQRINPLLIDIMEERGVYTKESLTDIIEHKGSVQHVYWLDDHEKMVFKTAFEIDQRAILRLASARQRFIDQGQSLNLFFDADEDEAYISEIHKEAILDPYIKGLYYLRSVSGIQVSKGECVACEG